MGKKDQPKGGRGVVPAPITPLQENGKINLPLLERQVQYLSAAGVDGFFVGGTTGEGPYLNRDERIEVFKTVREVSGGSQLLYLACINPSTESTVEEIRAFAHLEPDFIVVVAPFYYDASQPAIAQHFREIAICSEKPLVLYNIPQCTHNIIELGTILELSEVKNISGIKDSSGDFVSFRQGLDSTSTNDFFWFQGFDYLDGPSLMLGAHGLVTGLGNVWIEPYVALYHAAKNGNVEQVKENQRKIDSLHRIIRAAGAKIIPSIKAGCSILGRSEKWMKLRYSELNSEEISRVKEVLVELELL